MPSIQKSSSALRSPMASLTRLPHHAATEPSRVAHAELSVTAAGAGNGLATASAAGAAETPPASLSGPVSDLGASALLLAAGRPCRPAAWRCRPPCRSRSAPRRRRLVPCRQRCRSYALNRCWGLVCHRRYRWHPEDSACVAAWAWLRSWCFGSSVACPLRRVAICRRPPRRRRFASSSAQCRLRRCR